MSRDQAIPGGPDGGRAWRPCPVCEGRDLRPLRGYERAHLVRCRGCDLVFAGRDPTDAELARNYGGYSRADYDSSITRERYRELLRSFEPYRRANRILDMGCGIGFFLEEAQAAGWEAYGSEFEPRAVEIIQEKGLHCVRAPIGVDTFEPGSFDVITAFEVVEHLRDPQGDGEVIATALRPGGLFYCTTPNFASLSRRLLGGRWDVIVYPEHLSYFTPSTLRSWLTRHGLASVGIATAGFSPAHLRHSLGGDLSAPPTDERLRARTESSRSLRLAKRAANLALSSARMGDTIKGRFELEHAAGLDRAAD